MYKAILCRCKSCAKEKNYSINTNDINNVVFCFYCNSKIGKIEELVKLDEIAQKNIEAEALANLKAQKLKYEKEQARLQAEKEKDKEIFLNSVPDNFQLYHFTDIRNLDSIRLYGLLSWEKLEKEPFNYSREKDYFPASDPPGSHGYKEGLSRFLDRQKKHTNYVRLCKNTDHEMIEAAKKRGLDLCLLKIKTESLFDLDCLFADDNATTFSRPVEINKNFKTFINSDKNQAEVLVENCIPVEYIEKTFIKIK